MPTLVVPPEIWARVCFHLGSASQTVENKVDSSAKPSTKDLTVMLTVSKAFYHAAGPHLYRTVRTTDLTKWLLGALNHCPKLSVIEDDVFGVGNTKIPLLRHTKHVAIINHSYRPRETVYKLDGSSKSMNDFSSVEQEKLINDGIRQTAIIDSASDVLTTITSDHVPAFPRLELIQVGQKDWNETFYMAPWMYQEQGPIACLLMRKLKPKWWCQFGNGGVFCHPSTRPVEFTQNHLPEIYTAHSNVMETFVVLWGTTNHIYVHDSVSSPAHRSNLGRAGMISWIVDNITGSYPEDLGTVSQALCPIKIAIESKTSFVIHNLPSPDRRSNGTNSEFSESNEYRLAHLEWEEALVTEFHETIGRTMPYWRSLISVSPLAEHETCPRCRTDCRGW